MPGDGFTIDGENFGERPSLALVLGGMFLRRTDDFLVAEVHPIKHSDGQGHRTGHQGKLLDGTQF